MSGWIKTIGVEVWGLFVDDIALAICAAVWIALIAVGLRFGLPAGVAGPMLFLGLAAGLLISVGRARR